MLKIFTHYAIILILLEIVIISMIGFIFKKRIGHLNTFAQIEIF